jgi:hypothetical protein
MTNYPDIEKIGKISIWCIIAISDSSRIDELTQTGACRRY